MLNFDILVNYLIIMRLIYKCNQVTIYNLKEIRLSMLLENFVPGCQCFMKADGFCKLILPSSAVHEEREQGKCYLEWCGSFTVNNLNNRENLVEYDPSTNTDLGHLSRSWD